MSAPDQEKLGVKLHGRSSLDIISAVPIKKRRFIFSRSPSPPPETQSSLTVDCGTTRNKPFSSVQVPSLEATDIPTCLTAPPDEGSSHESGFKILVNGNISEASKYQDPIENYCNEKLRNMASIAVEGKNGLKVNVSDDKLISLNRIEHHPAPVGRVDGPMEEEILDAKYFSNPIYAAQPSGNNELRCKEIVETAHIKLDMELRNPSSRKETYGNTDSAQSSLDRLSWDLNTTMDTWEESMNDLTLNHEGDRQDRPGFGVLLGRWPQPNPKGASATNKKPNASPPMICESKSLSTGIFPSLCTSSPKSGGVCCNSDAEACLDLGLKPYLNYGTPLALGNMDFLKETQFLSLSTIPSSSSPDSKFSSCGTVKPEPYHGTIQLEERKTEIAGSEAIGLKPIKSEPCEIGDASRTTISGVVNSASDAAIKLEPAAQDKSQNSVATKETMLSHLSADDHNALPNAKTSLEAVGAGIIASNTKSDSFIKDVIMQMPEENPHLHKYEVDSTAQFLQNEVVSNVKMGHRTLCAEKEIFCEQKSLVDEGGESVSIKQISNEGSDRTDSLIKCDIEGQIKNLVIESCEPSCIVAESPCESFNSGTLVERVVDERGKIEQSRASSSETDSKTATEVEKYANCDMLESSQAISRSICSMEEQGDNEYKTGSSPHAMDVAISAVHEKDDHGYEDGEVKEEALLGGAQGDAHLKVEIKNSVVACLSRIVDVSVAMSSHELVKHSVIESSESSKNVGVLECVKNIDPAIEADLHESSSATGDSIRMKTSKTIRKTPRDSLKKDKFLERKVKSEGDPILGVTSIENKAAGSGIMENAGGWAKSSVPSSASESMKDSFDRGRSRTGRIINLNSASSREMKPIHERPLSSRVKRGNPIDKLFEREKAHSHRCRDENHSEKSHKTEIEKTRGLASESIHARVRDGSDYSHLRCRDKQQPNQFGDRNCEPNFMREQFNDHNGFRYSRANNSAAVSRASGSDASAPFAGRISRKVTNELQNRAHMACRRHSPGGPEQMPVMRHEVNPNRCTPRDAHDLAYVSHEKINRSAPGEMLDPLRLHPHSQFERTDRIVAHRERLSLSPVHHRGPPRLTPPMRSPRSRAMSPSHWSPHRTSEGFNGHPDMVQCRTGTPIAMQESMRSARQHYPDEILARRRGPIYSPRLSDGMMEVISSREHDLPRSGREFPRKIPRQIPGDYYHRAPFGDDQIHELAVDGECAAGRRCSELHAPTRYRQHCIADDDVEDFSFRGEEGPPPPRSYRYHPEGNQGFNEGGNSRHFEGRFKNRLGNTARRYRHIEQQQQHDEDGFRHQEGEGWNDSGFNNIRPKRRRY